MCVLRILYSVDIVPADAGSLRLLLLRQPLPADDDLLHGALPGPLKFTDAYLEIVRGPVLYKLTQFPDDLRTAQSPQTFLLPLPNGIPVYALGGGNLFQALILIKATVQDVGLLHRDLAQCILQNAAQMLHVKPVLCILECLGGTGVCYEIPQRSTVLIVPHRCVHASGAVKRVTGLFLAPIPSSL